VSRLSNAYVCGHSTRELDRLETQGAYFRGITRSFLQRAAITQGMRVLDIGCGTGDLTFLAAELVGPSGFVLGIDRAPEAIAAANARAAARGIQHVAFEVGEIEKLAPGPLDAVVGRFILMHQANPTRTLRAAAASVVPGGLIAVLESDISASVAGVHSRPHSPIYDRINVWLARVIRAAGAHPDMGLRLRRTFVDAGLPPPALWLQARVEGGPDAEIYQYIVESIRSLLPVSERLGICAPSPDLSELERLLRAEVVASGGVLTSPVVVGALCRLGGSR
jgi:ubiquinone/menaquinone biosynthesis C-methylase UbiE